eukprot:1372382-Prymnesium_polylepis.1
MSTSSTFSSCVAPPRVHTRQPLPQLWLAATQHLCSEQGAAKRYTRKDVGRGGGQADTGWGAVSREA